VPFGADGVTMLAIWIGLGVVVLVLLAVLISYNRFVSQRQYLRNSWSNVDTELRRRYDLIPNLVETVKGYAAHERETFERVIQARTQAVASHGEPAEQASDENVLVDALKQLLAVSEAYPDLEASENFLELQRELVTHRIHEAEHLLQAFTRDGKRKSIAKGLEEVLDLVRRFRDLRLLDDAGSPLQGVGQSQQPADGP
jgi:LemA protein